ncbi:hypothetical protein [Maricaulis sp.]|uniref:hypothetical protein n=1 Tax=Maricaulis sp. TaxID=1486257 RepID=UPI0026062743|nr:hypothetical protein [Maricaulis sp.]
MAEASGPDRQSTNAAKFRRAGLTEVEARRLARTEKTLEETRGFAQAPLIGMLFWLLWKSLLKGFQPAWLLASLGVAGWFALQIVDDLGGIDAVAPVPTDFGERVERLIEEHRTDDTGGAFDSWIAGMSDALDGDLRRRPDIDRFAAWASIGPYWIGRDELALRLMSPGRDPRELDAELRARPVQQREQALSLALRTAYREAARLDLEPPEIVFAPASLRQRYEAARPRWDLASEQAQAFFTGNEAGQLELLSLPGLSRRQAGATRLYGGTRHFVQQLCRAPGAQRSFGEACARITLPRERFDPFLFALSAVEAGFVDLGGQATPSREGAEIIRAGYGAGRLSPALEAELRDLLTELVSPQDLIAAAAMAEFRPDTAYATPQRVSRRLQGVVPVEDEALAGRLRTGLAYIDSIRSRTSATLTIRTLDALGALDQARELYVLVREVGPGVLILHETAGPAMYGLLDVDTAQPVSQGAIEKRDIHGVIAAMISAAMVLLLSIIRISTSPLIRSASRLRAIDASLSRLFLGKKV